MSKVKDLCACGAQLKPHELMCPECRQREIIRWRKQRDAAKKRKENGLKVVAAKLAICLAAAIALLIPLCIGMMSHGLLSFVASLIASIGYTVVLIYLVFIVHWLVPDWI